MGQSQSSDQQTSSSTSASATARPSQEISAEMKMQMLQGNKFIVDSMRPDMNKITDMFKNFNYHDPDQISAYINTINQSLPQGQSKIELSPDIMKAMSSVHDALTKQLSVDPNNNLTTEQRRNATRKAMSEMKVEDMFAKITQHFGEDVDKGKKEVFDRLKLAPNDTGISQPLDAMFKTIKDLKVRYKFFEYKYVELNIFMILFVQYSYEAIQNFSTNVLAFNAVREENRKQIMQEIFSEMNKVMTGSDIQVREADYTALRGMMTRLQTQMTQKNNEMVQNMEKVMQVSTENMAGFVGALTEATKKGLLSELNKPPGQQQQGGFVKDHSRFPQAFYDLGADRPAAS